MVELGVDDACPCGLGKRFGSCCAPVLADPRRATTAEALMRSRYVAFVVGDAAHLRATWHPRTRPQVMNVDPDQKWLGLKVKDTHLGTAGDEVGTVEFVARFKVAGRGHRLHEVSEFVKEDGVWFYVSGAHE